jgi:hypothetical protein
MDDLQVAQPAGAVGVGRHEVQVEPGQPPEKVAPQQESPDPAESQEAEQRQADAPVPRGRQRRVGCEVGVEHGRRACKTSLRRQQRHQHRGQQARGLRQAGLLPSHRARGQRLQGRQRVLRHDARADQVTHERTESRREFRLGEEEQRDRHQQAYVRADQRERKESAHVAAFEQREEQQDESGQRTERDTDQDGVGRATNQLQAAAQTVQRPAEQRERLETRARVNHEELTISRCREVPDGSS